MRVWVQVAVDARVCEGDGCFVEEEERLGHNIRLGLFIDRFRFRVLVKLEFDLN